MKLYLNIGKYGAYLIFFVLGLLYIRFYLFQIVIVEGNSMLPTLKHGDWVLVYKYNFSQKFANKSVYEFGKVHVRRLDILLFETKQGKLLLKRLIGMPGDFYAFRSGTIYIGSEPLTENYTLPGTKTLPPSLQLNNEEVFYPLYIEGRIPPGYYLLLGDNREISHDSRNLGLIPEDALRGRVIFIF